MTPEFLQTMLPATTAWCIRLLVGGTQRRAYSARASELLTPHPHLVVRQSGRIHDRFLCHDGEEVYAFGHSLGALQNGRVSYFHRVTNAEDIAAIQPELEQGWSGAAPIIGA